MTEPLVSAAWVAEHLAEVVVSDVRWDPIDGPAGTARAFAEGHLPGAVHVDADRDLAAAPFDGPGRHPLPSPDAFARMLGRAGIADDDLVVAYDDQGGGIAARLWWMLDVTGRRCVVLDGGRAAWQGPLERGPGAARPTVEASVRPWPRERVADADDVAAALAAGNAAIVDARAADRFRGDVEPIDPVAGHIPGATSRPWAENLGPDGRFLEVAELRGLYGSLGPVIAHCGSGLTACHDLLALRVAGLADGRLYEGSWSDWVHDRSRPVATGDDA